MIQLLKNIKIEKIDYRNLAVEFIGNYSENIISAGQCPEEMVSDTAEALRYDPKFKNIDADLLYDAIIENENYLILFVE